MEKKVAFLGPNGTFSEEAARFLFKDEQVSFTPFSSIPNVLDALGQGEADYAVVPIENSIEGTVNLTMDWLIHQIDIPIRGEIAYPISQHIMAARKMELGQVEKVLSHPQAIAQSRLFLQSHLPHAEMEYTKSTAEAVDIVSANPDRRWAAIGNRLAQAIYPVHFLQENIQDRTNNYTRFLLVSTLEMKSTDTDREKTTILVTLPSDFPGALHQVLAAFAWRKINLTRIESRPTKTGLGNYHFIVDIDQKFDGVLMPAAFAEMKALGCQIRILGSYPCYVIDEEVAGQE